MTNQELMKRAAITTEQIASAGKLNPEQAAKFIDYVQDLSVFKNLGRIERFRAEEKTIEKIGVGNRVAYPKAEATDPIIRRLVSTSKVTLAPQDIIVPFEIGDRFLRYNIEGDGAEDHVIRMMADTLANNLDELWNGGIIPGPARLESEIFMDGSTTQYIRDIYLQLFDGFLKQAESGHVVDAENAAISASVFNKALQSMPVKFKRDKRNLKFMLSPDHEQAYREYTSQRATPLGDNALQSEANLTPFGIELVPIPLMERNPLYSENSVANNDGTTPTPLSFKPIQDLILTPTSIAKQPAIDAYVEGAGNDYTEDLTNGAWTRLAGNITSAQTVLASYRTGGKMLLTNPQNLILAIGLDVQIERDRNIYRGVNEYAITVSVDCKFEETDAVVLVKNLADPTL